MTGRAPAWVRVVAALLALQAFLIGGWALVSPTSWFGWLPGFGIYWGQALGRYDPILVSDVGGLYIGFAFALGIAAWHGSRGALIPVLAGWVVFSLVHLVSHLAHFTMPGSLDMLSTGALALVLFAAAATVHRLLRGQPAA